jgi:membrane associated rhomboid family serine protease
MSQSPPEPSEDDQDGAPKRREPAFNLPGIVLAAIGICAGVHLIRLYALDVEQDLALLVRTAFIPIRYSGQFDIDFYAFSSPFTYAFLHGGFAHLAINMIWLAAFGSPLANRLGAARFAAFWAATGLAAAGLHYMFHPLDSSPLVGASGAISGMMGAAARFGFRIDRSEGRAAFAGEPLPVPLVLRMRGVLTFLVIWMAVNLASGLVGFAPGVEDRIAWEAHIGGFLAGFFGIRLFDRAPLRNP